MYLSSPWARILNVQDIKKERTKEVPVSSSIYLRLVFLPPPSLLLANIQYLPTMYLVQRSYVGLLTKYRFKVRPALQPIAGSMPVNRLRRCPNTNLSPCLLYTLRKHMAFSQCCFKVDQQSSTLALH